MKLHDALTLSLLKLGIKKVFGVSGANIEYFHDALYRLGDNKLEAVLAKCESGAASMADGYARVHKTIGVCCATSGGGMTNLVSGIAESYQEGIGVLAIVGQPPTPLHGRGAFQDSQGIGHTINALSLFESISKYTSYIKSGEEFWPKFATAIQACISKRRGPAVLLIPRDVFEQKVGPIPPNFFDNISSATNYPPPFQSDINLVHEKLQKAHNPVLVFGLGIKISHLQQEAIKLAQALNIPVFTDIGAKCAYPNYLPNYFGTLGVAGNPSAHNYINSQSDLVIALGTTLPLMCRGPIETGLINNTIVIDIDIESALRATSLLHAISCEPGVFCRKFNNLLQPKKLKPALPAYERTVMLPKLINISNYKTTDLLRQSEAIALISSILPKNGHLVFDAGNCAAAALHYLDIPTGTTSTIALGMGGMGYSVGAAIGAQMGSSQHSRTIAILGDGAFLMSGLEIHTAIEHKLPILFIVFNNSRHGMCVTRQKIFFEDRISASTYSSVHVQQIVSGLGSQENLQSVTTTTAQELEEALTKYQKTSHLTWVIELCIKLEEEPPFTPFSTGPLDTISITEPIKNIILKTIKKQRQGDRQCLN